MKAAIRITLSTFLVMNTGPGLGADAAGLPARTGACARHAEEAARRAGLAATMVLKVMLAESAGDSRAVSVKDAMGCMQIMPATWRYLTRRHGLGSNPFDARMNMIGGALYLAELVARFGLPGAYSAYNAGPGRYRRHIAHGTPLPAETRAYTARLSEHSLRQNPAPIPSRWQEASLFVKSSDAPPAHPAPAMVAGEHAFTPSMRAVEFAQSALFPLDATIESAQGMVAPMESANSAQGPIIPRE